MSADRDPLVTQALPKLTVSREQAVRAGKRIAPESDRRPNYRPGRVAGWLIALPLFLFAAWHAAWNRTDVRTVTEPRHSIAGFLKMSSSSAEDYDLLDDAQREEMQDAVNAPRASHVFSRAPVEGGDQIDDAQREDPVTQPNTVRI